jgi:hypothetical protein
VCRMTLRGSSGTTELLHSTSTRIESVRVGAAGQPAKLHVYDRSGHLILDRPIDGRVEIHLPDGGLAVVGS